MITGDIVVRVADESDEKYAVQITDEMELSAKVRGSGISRRSPESIREKMRQGKAIIAIGKDGAWAGFSYIETWSHEEFVSNWGLIVSPIFRGRGIAKKIKQKIIELCSVKYPQAKIFSITTGLAIMKMNHDLGFAPVTFNEITKDEKFWLGCKSCVNYAILQAHDCKNCLCTAMLCKPQPDKKIKISPAANSLKKQ